MSPLGAYLLETLVTLSAVVLLAFVVLYGARRLGVGAAKGPLELVGRLPIDARRAVYLVRVGELVYVVGASEGGLTKLGEVGADAVSHDPQPPARFADIVTRIKARPPAVEAPIDAAPGAAATLPSEVSHG